MCGILGIWWNDDRADVRRVHRAVDALAHRGPDDEGFAFIRTTAGDHASFGGAASPVEIRRTLPSIESAEAWASDRRPDLALGHRRFSIIAPSPEGHQPFWDADGRHCLIFNGEIYNYLELREELRRCGHQFRTETDTEVLIEAYREWGDACFERLNGMWAIALYDVARRELILARDRAGERPLYLMRRPEGLYFASEIRALLQAADMTGTAEADERSVLNFLHPASDKLTTERTFFRGIEMMPAATVMRIRRGEQGQSRRYWALPEQRATEQTAPSVDDLCEQLRELLRSSVSMRLRADVPVTAALSGGMDSSAVVAMAARESARRLHTYTVRFQERGWNEWPFAAAVAAHCGVDSLVVDPPQQWMWDHLQQFVGVMEEPFHAPDLLTDHLVRRTLAAQGFRVSLSGIGGDEIFAGYELFRWLHARELMASGHFWGGARELALASDGRPLRALPGRLSRIARGRTTTRAAQSHDLFSRAVHHDEAGWSAAGVPTSASGRLRGDFESLLLPYWLRAGDKGSMCVPMEVRFPLLDHRLVEFAFRLPMSYLVRNGWLKWIFRRATAPLLPRHIVWRRTKMGFPFPMTHWLLANRGTLHDVFSRMDNPFLRRSFWTTELDVAIRNDPYLVWRALSLELWFARFIRHDSVPLAEIASERAAAGT